MCASLLVGLISVAVQAQTWEWRNPLPQGNRLRAVDFVDVNNGWAVGDYGAILHTTTGDASWVPCG
jgi:photosystem II stability/assembly factor-like uncharacterized protein